MIQVVVKWTESRKRKDVLGRLNGLKNKQLSFIHCKIHDPHYETFTPG